MRYTVEAAIIVPLFLLVFGVSINLLFYYHDKNVIGAAAYETVAIGSGRYDHEADDLEGYFQKRVEGRTFLFSKVTGKVEMTEDKVEITCETGKGIMKIALKRQMCITDPEDYIRSIRKIKEIQDENLL